MSIPESETLKKSETHSFNLPHINKAKLRLPVNYKTSQSAAKTRQHNSVFLQKIMDLTKDTKYQEMETVNITQQQKQLKQIVREFNQETYHILGRYLDKASMATTDRKDINSSRTTEMKRSTRGHSVSMMAQLHDKQIFNSNEAIEICKKELSALEKRSENLKYMTTEEFNRKIQTTREQIQKQKEVIKEILRQNTLRGLEIKREDNTEHHDVSMLQYEKYILEKKKQRLQSDSKYVSEEQAKIKQKHAEGDRKIQQMGQEYEKTINEDKNGKQQVDLKKKLEQKRRQLYLKKEKRENLAANNGGVEQKTEQKIQLNDSIMENNSKTLGLKQNDDKMQQKSGQLTAVVKKAPSAQIKFQPPASNIINKYQQQYLKLLKQLDETLGKTKSHQNRMESVTQRVQQSKIQILAYQHKLAALKKNSPASPQKGAVDAENDKNKPPQKNGFMASLFG